MPLVNVAWIARDTETKRKIAQRITEVFVEETKCPASAVHISFVDCEKDSIAHGGVLIIDQK